MPELPEVETVKNLLKSIVINNKIVSIDVLRTSTIVGDINEFKNTLTNQTFKDITRIGKFLIFHFTNNIVMISHLRMEGKYFEIEENEPNTKYARVVFHLDNNHKICYDDSRCFGMMKLTTESEYKEVPDIAKLGPEPFAISDIDSFYKKVKNIKLPIKSTLLDQSVMTGLGNIYVDETLFKSKIHPETPANLLSKEEWKTIINNASSILNAAIEAGGSTIRSYHPGKNIDGNFQFSLNAYGKFGEDCPTCGHPYRFIKVGGRGTTFCPNCQIKRSKLLKIAIFGKVASGKSTVLNIIKDNGYKVISCDEIIADLYKNKDFFNEFNAKLGFSFKNEIDKNVIREWVLKDIKNKKKIEKLVHPKVKEEIEKSLKNKTGLIFVEVPLLFESKMENMFDVIIAVDIDKEKQIERLQKRNPDTANQLRLLNANNTFEENKKKADFVILNNSSLRDLNKQVNNTINKLKARLS